MSSSRNEPCINRSVRANAPAKTTLPPVCEQEIIDVEAVPAEPIVPATASIIDTAPAVEAPIVETGIEYLRADVSADSRNGGGKPTGNSESKG